MPDLFTSDRIALDTKRHDHVVDPLDQISIDEPYVWFNLPWTLPSLSRALLCTVGEVDIPPTTIGFIQLRSTWARMGLISPPTVADPGFKGDLTMEVFNASANPIMILPNIAIWSMHLIATSHEPLYRGRYQGQQGITLPKALSNE